MDKGELRSLSGPISQKHKTTLPQQVCSQLYNTDPAQFIKQSLAVPACDLADVIMEYLITKAI